MDPPQWVHKSTNHRQRHRPGSNTAAPLHTNPYTRSPLLLPFSEDRPQEPAVFLPFVCSSSLSPEHFFMPNFRLALDKLGVLARLHASQRSLNVTPPVILAASLLHHEIPTKLPASPTASSIAHRPNNMASLTLPEAGILLESPQMDASKLRAAPRAIGLTLTDEMIEDMIRCVQNNKPIQLCLGEAPVSNYLRLLWLMFCNCCGGIG